MFEFLKKRQEKKLLKAIEKNNDIIKQIQEENKKMALKLDPRTGKIYEEKTEVVKPEVKVEVKQAEESPKSVAELFKTEQPEQLEAVEAVDDTPKLSQEHMMKLYEAEMMKRHQQQVYDEQIARELEYQRQMDEQVKLAQQVPQQVPQQQVQVQQPENKCIINIHLTNNGVVQTEVDAEEVYDFVEEIRTAMMTGALLELDAKTLNGKHILFYEIVE